MIKAHKTLRPMAVRSTQGNLEALKGGYNGKRVRNGEKQKRINR
jgi:hypothetical protein